MPQDTLRDLIASTVQHQNGVIFAHSENSFVYRGMYNGRNIIRPNQDGNQDERGYFAVEWWIMSCVTAGNEKKKENEGLTMLELRGGKNSDITLCSFAQALNIAGKDILLGEEHINQWPLTKILDIGGNPVKPDFGKEFSQHATEEVPPIPCHIHSGLTFREKQSSSLLHDGISSGKHEAYFFPPLNFPPYNMILKNTKTRLGLKPSVTKEQFENSLTKFGIDDSCYALLNSYDIQPYDGWTIPPGIVHAPGPYLTFEIQYPQDDYHLASWRLGQKILDFKHLRELKESNQLRGLENEAEFIKKLVDWNSCVDPHFKQSHYRPSKAIEEGPWGRRLQIFFDQFYGEGIEILPNQCFIHQFQRPFAGIIWSGKGTLNSNPIDASKDNHKEFLVVKNTKVTIINEDQQHSLIIWTIFPLHTTKETA